MRTEYRVAFVFSLTFVTIILLSVFLCPVRTAAQNPSQTCNQTGILIRSDGTVLLDTWKDFSAMRNPMPPAPNQNITQGFTSVDLPNSITLGKSLSDKVKICIETDNGSHCVPLEQIRKVK